MSSIKASTLNHAILFTGNIASGIELANAKVYKLEKGNQFYTKYFLEKEDTTTNYLIYAPFPK